MKGQALTSHWALHSRPPSDFQHPLGLSKAAHQRAHVGPNEAPPPAVATRPTKLYNNPKMGQVNSKLSHEWATMQIAAMYPATPNSSCIHVPLLPRTKFPEGCHEEHHQQRPSHAERPATHQAAAHVSMAGHVSLSYKGQASTSSCQQNRRHLPAATTRRRPPPSCNKQRCSPPAANRIIAMQLPTRKHRVCIRLWPAHTILQGL